jgi:hypothetical protein
MSYADYTGFLFSGQAGVFFRSGTVSTALRGQYFQVHDGCLTTQVSSNSGDIDLGGGNSTCGAVTGSTLAGQTSTYHLNRIRDVAKNWLPSLGFLQDGNVPIDVYTYVTSDIDSPNSNDLMRCNSHFTPLATPPPAGQHEHIQLGYDPVVCDSQCCAQFPNCPISQCSQCGPECCTTSTCSNLGEIASVIDHEWGHALDAHDQPSGPNDDAQKWYSNPTEAYADIAAAYTLQTSCIGYGSWRQPGPNSTACPAPAKTMDQTGYNINQSNIPGMTHCAVDCSGFRELDYTQHNFSPLPSDCTDPHNCPDTPQNFSCQQCGPALNGAEPGPCGKDPHCESAPATQAAWDLATRDLPTTYGLDTRTAFDVASRLFYQGSATAARGSLMVATPTAPTSSGSPWTTTTETCSTARRT